MANKRKRKKKLTTIEDVRNKKRRNLDHLHVQQNSSGTGAHKSKKHYTRKKKHRKEEE